MASFLNCIRVAITPMQVNNMDRTIVFFVGSLFSAFRQVIHLCYVCLIQKTAIESSEPSRIIGNYIN